MNLKKIFDSVIFPTTISINKYKPEFVLNKNIIIPIIFIMILSIFLQKFNLICEKF